MITPTTRMSFNAKNCSGIVSLFDIQMALSFIFIVLVMILKLILFLVVVF